MIGLQSSPRHRELVERVFGIDPGIVPPGVLIEPSDRLDWQIWKREQLVVGILLQAAVAAQNSFAQLFNPVGSNVVVTVEQVAVKTVAGVLVDQFYDTVARGAVGAPTQMYRDSRIVSWVGAAASPITFRQGTAVGNPGGIQVWEDSVTAGVWTRLTGPATSTVLAPGAGYELNDGTVNEALTVALLYRFRPMREEEKTF